MKGIFRNTRGRKPVYRATGGYAQSRLDMQDLNGTPTVNPIMDPTDSVWSPTGALAEPQTSWSPAPTLRMQDNRQPSINNIGTGTGLPGEIAQDRFRSG